MTPRLVSTQTAHVLSAFGHWLRVTERGKQASPVCRGATIDLEKTLRHTIVGGSSLHFRLCPRKRGDPTPRRGRQTGNKKNSRRATLGWKKGVPGDLRHRRRSLAPVLVLCQVASRKVQSVTAAR